MACISIYVVYCIVNRTLCYTFHALLSQKKLPVMYFLCVLVLAPAAAIVVTSGVYKRKPPTLQSWKQPFPSQRKQGGKRLHMRLHIPAQHQKQPSGF